MNQGAIWGRFMKKTRGQKSRATVPLKWKRPLASVRSASTYDWSAPWRDGEAVSHTSDQICVTKCPVLCLALGQKNTRLVFCGETLLKKYILCENTDLSKKERHIFKTCIPLWKIRKWKSGSDFVFKGCVFYFLYYKIPLSKNDSLRVIRFFPLDRFPSSWPPSHLHFFPLAALFSNLFSFTWQRPVL